MTDLITAQDSLDGSALRRLREALREYGLARQRSIRMDIKMTADDAWRIWASSYLPKATLADEVVARGKGSTVAEAADQCREGLLVHA